jgi:hypothetical protein
MGKKYTALKKAESCILPHCINRVLSICVIIYRDRSYTHKNVN